MLSWRVLASVLALCFASTKLTTCRSPGDGGKGPAAGSEPGAVVDLPGVETSELTAREKRDWSSLVTDLLAPCPDQPVSIAQCVKESRDCKTCEPAAEFLVRMVRRGKTRSQIETAHKLRFVHDQVKNIPVGDAPAKGAANAAVVIVEFADFECPACAGVDPLLDQLVEKYESGVRLVFKNYPLSIHQNAEKAARAGVAAKKQSKFWELHRAMFEATRKDVKLDETVLMKLAKQAGLDQKQFAEDLASEAVADAVSRDRKQGDALQLTGTPGIFINGRHFDLDYFDVREDLEPWVKLELELAGKKAEARPAAPKGSAPALSASVNVPAPKPAPSGMATTK